ncbi:receptor-type tyrosine-protein phosphatase eta-like [Meleagris gallopavo]|uniref:receptor-type tyrosine-protein phosphatase eta-like n=1 Tax=Meleagris gallopavo TaxID=9103 RepID=UPI000549B5F2|nr:receptor-type tyrosine-protein phosphatase eta-like [Meleagris gallopavo]
MGTSSNDELSVNATSGNRRLSEDVSLSGRATSDQNSVAQPSAVLDVKAEYVGVTSVNLTWTVNDTASNSYRYRIEVRNGPSINNETSNNTETEITGLTPGTPYTFTVFAVAADGETEGEGTSISLYTSK